jgi:hypothetical protein
MSDFGHRQALASRQEKLGMEGQVLGQEANLRDGICGYSFKER